VREEDTKNYKVQLDLYIQLKVYLASTFVKLCPAFPLSEWQIESRCGWRSVTKVPVPSDAEVFSHGSGWPGA